MKKVLIATCCIALLSGSLSVSAQTLAGKSWSADNGNGTFTNPLFYDEFSDPDIIRVGEDYYLAGTTMHSVQDWWFSIQGSGELGIFFLLFRPIR